MDDWKPPFDQDDVELVSRESPFQGFFRVDRVRVKHRLYRGGWSDVIQREVFVRPEAVAVLPYDPVLDEILLVEQYRAGALGWRSSPWCLELIAGIADKDGESRENLVRREAEEEAGLALGDIVPICDYMPSPGGSDERLYVFLAQADLSQTGGYFGNPEEGEDIRSCRVAVKDIPALLGSGWVDNAASQVALNWFLLHGQHWKARWRQG